MRGALRFLSVDGGERPVRARLAIFAIFFLNGFVFANWVPRIPEVRIAIGASEGELGSPWASGRLPLCRCAAVW